MPNTWINTILGWCGISVATQRTRITSDLLSAPEGLEYFYNKSTEELLSTFQEYGRRDAADGKINFTRVQQKRLIALKDWVNDRKRLNKETAFKTGTTRKDFIDGIKEASERRKFRQEQKKVGESLITAALQVKLETANQWDRWVVELESNLKMIIRAKGISLSYVI